jgi:hypothetical protein
VLDRDILTCPVEDVRGIQVEQTYLGGKLIYSLARERAACRPLPSRHRKGADVGTRELSLY